MTPLEHALRYAQRGWRVIPAPPGSKHPSAREWQKTACADLNMVIAWWTQFPDANICIATGQESGIWVLDVDDKDSCQHPQAHGKGSCTLYGLERENGPLPPTYAVATGSGGVHYYWRWNLDFDLRNSAGKLGPGLDTRGNGGQVVAPPSRASDPTHYMAYDVLDAREPVDAPAWLVNLLRPRKHAYTPPADAFRNQDTGGILGWLSGVLPGEQDAALCWVVRALRDEGKTAQAVGDLVWPVVASWPCSRGPWTHRDIERHLRSAYGGAVA